MTSLSTLGELKTRGELLFGDGYRTKRSELADAGFRILRAGDIVNGQPDYSSLEFVSSDYRAAIGEKMVRQGDVILTTKGTVGRTAFVREEPAGRAVYSPQLCFFRAPRGGGIHDRFLYYWFSSPEFKHQASSLQSSTDMAPYISLSQLAGVRISLPSQREQQAIADVLGALDDKIAANNRLDSTACALMVAQAAHLPTTARLGDLVVLEKTQLSSSVLAETHQVSHYSLPAYDAGQVAPLETGSSILSSKFVLSGASVLLSKLNPRFPRVWDVPTPEPNAVASTEFLVLRPLSLSTSALWAVLANPKTTAYLSEHAGGTSGSHQRVRPDAALELPVPSSDSFPPRLLDLLSTLGARAQCARRESRTLAELREALLPKLMDGTLRVKDAERLAEETL